MYDIFTYAYYENMLMTAKKRDFAITSFENYDKNKPQTIILRHDIDYTLSGVLELATIEKALNITATYFFRVHAHEYNLFSPYVYHLVSQLLKMGHEIGLHYEAPAVARALNEDPYDILLREISVFETILKTPVKTISEHKDFSHAIYKTDDMFDKYISDKIGAIRNAMSPEYFNEMKYLSDSNANWREGSLLQHLTHHKRFQVLVHPDWWHESNFLLKGPYYHRYIAPV